MFLPQQTSCKNKSHEDFFDNPTKHRPDFFFFFKEVALISLLLVQTGSDAPESKAELQVR